MTEQRSLELILHNEVQQLLDNFAAVMRVHVVFFGRDGEVLRRGRDEGNCRFCQLVQNRFSIGKCLKLDREKQKLARNTGRCQTYICHAGLWEAIMPVMPGGELLGYIVFGQMRSTGTLPGHFQKQFAPALRREHWYGGTLRDEAEGLKCMKCGFTVWGKSEMDVIGKWNEAVKQNDN